MNDFEIFSLADEAGEPGPGPGEVLVHGIYCSRGHFGSPDAIFCSSCGISMVQQTHREVLGPRPPLGVLVSDRGDVFSLARDLVVGREPGTAPDVADGSRAPILLEDPGLSVSRVHLRVLLDGWQVAVQDAGSANGTSVSADGITWTAVSSEVPTRIVPGTRIAVGERVLTFETHQRS